MNLLADTAGWMALYDERDKYQAGARAAFRSLLNQKVVFVVTDYILAETVTLILYRVGHAQATRCGESLLNSPHVKLVRIGPDLWNDAWAMFKRYDDKEFSFTDCTSFVVMRQENLRDAFSFDHHFEQMGFRLWPR